MLQLTDDCHNPTCSGMIAPLGVLDTHPSVLIVYGRCVPYTPGGEHCDWEYVDRGHGWTADHRR